MKYKQPGYRDGERKERKDRATREERESRSAERQVRHAMQRTVRAVMRCADCGHQTAGQITIDTDTACSKCGASLHSCRNCRFFDTSARLECQQPIPKRMSSKMAANQCEFFEGRAVLDATGKRAQAPSQPRDAFDALFRK
ncbi:MAG: hypothetical protein ACE5HD_10150 [Acidobacteriota bacterium]